MGRGGGAERERVLALIDTDLSVYRYLILWEWEIVYYGITGGLPGIGTVLVQYYRSNAQCTIICICSYEYGKLHYCLLWVSNWAARNVQCSLIDQKFRTGANPKTKINVLHSYNCKLGPNSLDFQAGARL